MQYVNQIKLMSELQDIAGSTMKLSPSQRVTCGKNLLLIALSFSRVEQVKRTKGRSEEVAHTFLDNIADIARVCKLTIDSINARSHNDGVLFTKSTEEAYAFEIMGKSTILVILLASLFEWVFKQEKTPNGHSIDPRVYA